MAEWADNAYQCFGLCPLKMFDMQEALWSSPILFYYLHSYTTNIGIIVMNKNLWFHFCISGYINKAYFLKFKSHNIYNEVTLYQKTTEKCLLDPVGNINQAFYTISTSQDQIAVWSTDIMGL